MTTFPPHIRSLTLPLALLGCLASTSALADDGVRFSCSPSRLAKVESGVDAYLNALGIAPAWYVKHKDQAARTLTYSLNTPPDDTDTLTLSARPEYQVQDDTVELLAQDGKVRTVHTVSQKEIVLALLQHGRLTEFKGKACDSNAFKEHVGIRQNTVAWIDPVEWHWPDGDAATWNPQYWHRGTPNPGVSLSAAVNDIFFNQTGYGFGCYTATKLTYIQGVLDYYQRVKPDTAKLSLVNTRLMADQDPLVHVEPGIMWKFEPDYDPAEGRYPGKLVRIMENIPANNFVPGDWSYFLNTDAATYQKTGYEGSNAVYLGRGKFDDYYNDNDHAYTFRQKLDEVYQWRNGVFSRSRDGAKIKPFTEQEFARLVKTPEEGGLLLNIRVVPYYFGYEKLPI